MIMVLSIICMFFFKNKIAFYVGGTMHFTIEFLTALIRCDFSMRSDGLYDTPNPHWFLVQRWFLQFKILPIHLVLESTIHF